MTRQANPLRQQLLPVITIPDGTFGSPEADKKARLVYETMATAFQRLQALIDTDPRMSDTRIAHGVTTQQGDVIFDYATLPNPGDVPYAVDGGRRAVWGSGGTPAPTGGGVGPTGASGPLLDANHNTDTVAQTVSRGSLIYGNSTPKWDELVKPSVASVLKNDATDAAWVTIPTRRLWIPAATWLTLLNTAPVPDASGGATPDTSYHEWILADALDAYVGVTVEVPDNWTTGTITVKCHWTPAVQLNLNWVPHFYWLERVDGDDMTAAGTHITGPTTSANFAPDILKITTVGTFTPTGAGKLLRLVFARLASSDANDTYTDDINFIGVELSFTPSY